MTRLRTLHLVVGATGLVAFALTGQYMHWVHDHLQGMPDGPRMFFRSAHIYLLWGSLLNLLLGCYLSRLGGKLANQLQFLASAAILAGPALLCFSFFFEQYTPALLRPAGRWAIFLSAGGVAAHALAVVAARVQARLALAERAHQAPTA